MKKFLKNILQVATSVGAVLTLCAGKVMAMSIQEGAEAARGEGMPSELVGPEGILTRFTNIALYVVGVLSVIMLIWGGLRYILSGGDAKKITDAKNTILYALIGLAIAFFAFAIVNFVLNAIAPGAQNETSLLLLGLPLIA